MMMMSMMSMRMMVMTKMMRTMILEVEEREDLLTAPYFASNGAVMIGLRKSPLAPHAWVRSPAPPSRLILRLLFRVEEYHLLSVHYEALPNTVNDAFSTTLNLVSG